ncbi:MAG: hypothetical protein ACE5K7_04210 [Phycisphaerae bacterium]
MALFKSSQQRRVERDIKIRQGVRRIEKAIREQAKFQEEFIRNAQRAQAIGDRSQYQFIRNSLKKTATIRKMLERQLLAVKNALLIKRQAEAAADFAGAMGTMAREIGRLFGQTDLARTQSEWERAMVQSQTMEERMGMFLEAIEDLAAQDVESAAAGELVSDEEIDRMIAAEAEAEHAKQLERLQDLRAEIDSLKQSAQREEK